jgi:hypothetical protein
MTFRYGRLLDLCNVVDIRGHSYRLKGQRLSVKPRDLLIQLRPFSSRCPSKRGQD